MQEMQCSLEQVFESLVCKGIRGENKQANDHRAPTERICLGVRVLPIPEQHQDLEGIDPNKG